MIKEYFKKKWGFDELKVRLKEKEDEVFYLKRDIFEKNTFIRIGDERLEKACQKIDKLLGLKK